MIYEENVIIKKPLQVDIRAASVYPNLYKTAMSSLGYQIIYEMINERKDSWCERVVYPNIRSIESNSPLKDFDIISFSLQYEQDYFNMLEILKKAEIPIKREERNNNNYNNKYPLIIAGGPCATGNPMPISDFIDVFIIGEAEEVLNNFLDLYKELKYPQKEVESFTSIKGVYIPAVDNKVEKVIVENMDNAFHITNPIIVKCEKKEDEEFLPVFGNSILLNVSRGCSRGCRFCMSGYLYRPMRETSLEKLLSVAEEARKNTEINKISLIGAAVSDYSEIDELTKELLARKFQISTPSMRIESIKLQTLQKLKKSGAKTITIAPESIYSLRKSINKNIEDNKIFKVIKDALNLGFNIKLYFLIGLPNETYEDIENLAEYIKKINSLKHNENSNRSSNRSYSRSSNKSPKRNSDKHSKKNSIKFSINPMIPKPQTPMQWEGYDLKDIKSKIKYMKSELKGIDVKFDSAKMGLIQYVLSCKGKEVGEILEKSLQTKISLQEWKKFSNGYDSSNIDNLPWKNIDIGLNHKFLKKEREKMFNIDLTPWCEEKPCYGCGSCNKIEIK
ncbi:radical SAM protein [Methanobrevibacter sp. TMH8]|uniref:radical SAM protein n=1 Tax=Methanobrevibacter sp. TMH8 TaxID=2848611 RepID=UPI001CCEB492|nr:radical SAM protein [Methanobrevibacter sp. TMH8]MBZ9571631.1 radical SAM protein [Methanobrevibacter sp. TMH8]